MDDLPEKLDIKLYKKIEDAFCDSPYPGDEHLVRTLSPRCCETYLLLRGRGWRHFPGAEFFSLDTPIADLTAAGFRYYMPAMLIHGFEQPEVTGSVLFYLSPDSEDSSDEYADKLQTFSGGQIDAIRHVLKEYANQGWESEENVRRAIQNMLSVQKIEIADSTDDGAP